MKRFTIVGSFPGLNQYIDACRISRGRWNKGNAMKQKDQKMIEQQIPRFHTDGPIRIQYDFYCPDRKKDLDNISGYFHKIFQDALVQAGAIPGDGWRYIKGFSDTFHLDPKRPRVEITITEE